ncbi:hypothetical protein M3Y99_01330100 [Aphelenchoides fujianensis]|nr:hypothetical protein M3Y99_01330100 [Aphelenchoides fujianensis]
MRDRTRAVVWAFCLVVAVGAQVQNPPPAAPSAAPSGPPPPPPNSPDGHWVWVPAYKIDSDPMGPTDVKRSPPQAAPQRPPVVRPQFEQPVVPIPLQPSAQPSAQLSAQPSAQPTVPAASHLPWEVQPHEQTAVESLPPPPPSSGQQQQPAAQPLPPPAHQQPTVDLSQFEAVEQPSAPSAAAPQPVPVVVQPAHGQQPQQVAMPPAPQPTAQQFQQQQGQQHMHQPAQQPAVQPASPRPPPPPPSTAFEQPFDARGFGEPLYETSETKPRPLDS